VAAFGEFFEFFAGDFVERVVEAFLAREVGSDVDVKVFDAD
jgi:hypothetical protein